MSSDWEKDEIWFEGLSRGGQLGIGPSRTECTVAMVGRQVWTWGPGAGV